MPADRTPLPSEESATPSAPKGAVDLTKDPLTSSYEHLRLQSAELNRASEELAKSIAPIDAALKTLNLGIVAWLRYDGEMNSEGVEVSDYIGYAKVSGRWGLALSRVRDLFAGEDWLFNDAPRAMRVAAVRHIPALLDQLSKEVSRTSEELRESASRASHIAATLSGSAKTPKAEK